MPWQHTSPVPSPGRHHVLHAPMCVVTTQGYATCSLQVRGDHFGTDEPRPGLHRWMAGLKEVSWTQTCLWPNSSLHPCSTCLWPFSSLRVQQARAHGTGGLASALCVYAPEADGQTCGTPLRASGAVSPMSLVKKLKRLSTSGCWSRFSMPRPTRCDSSTQRVSPRRRKNFKKNCTMTACGTHK